MPKMGTKRFMTPQKTNGIREGEKKMIMKKKMKQKKQNFLWRPIQIKDEYVIGGAQGSIKV